MRYGSICIIPSLNSTGDQGRGEEKNLVKIQSISASAQEFTGLCGNDLRLRRLKLDMIGRLGRF